MSEWVSVEEKLPDDCQYVIVGRTKSENSMEACFPALYVDDKFWVPTISGQRDMVNPTHWKTLPDPPRN